MSVHYVAVGGRVWAGQLATVGTVEGSGATVLLGAGGRLVRPEDVRRVEVPARMTEDERALISGAVESGYFVGSA